MQIDHTMSVLLNQLEVKISLFKIFTQVLIFQLGVLESAYWPRILSIPSKL